MTDKVVIDTNIWISALIAPSGVSAKLVDLWRKGKFRLIMSEQQMTELSEVLTRPRFAMGSLRNKFAVLALGFRSGLADSDS